MEEDRFLSIYAIVAQQSHNLRKIARESPIFQLRRFQNPRKFRLKLRTFFVSRLLFSKAALIQVDFHLAYLALSSLVPASTYVIL